MLPCWAKGLALLLCLQPFGNLVAQVISNAPVEVVLPQAPLITEPPAGSSSRSPATNTPPDTVDAAALNTYVPELKLVPGSAIAGFGRHKVQFDANIGTARPTRITTPGGTVLHCRPTLLAYYDSSTGKSVLLAEVQGRVGGAIQPDQIIYQDALDDLKADILYTCTYTSLEQDLILRQRPPVRRSSE